jgi:hypothetical protein
MRTNLNSVLISVSEFAFLVGPAKQIWLLCDAAEIYAFILKIASMVHVVT